MGNKIYSNKERICGKDRIMGTQLLDEGWEQELQKKLRQEQFLSLYSSVIVK
jgi:hypothetical protein